MRFIQWLAKKLEKKPERDTDEENRPLSKSPLVEKMNEIENGIIKVDEPKKFIHEETGKSYKTERALKAAITRFKKKQAKETKFIDDVTGKEYKTERALKAGITRRKNKQKKNSEEK